MAWYLLQIKMTTGLHASEIILKIKRLFEIMHKPNTVAVGFTSSYRLLGGQEKRHDSGKFGGLNS
jgi:hypothetical protein